MIETDAMIAARKELMELLDFEKALKQATSVQISVGVEKTHTIKTINHDVRAGIATWVHLRIAKLYKEANGL